jgi:glycosyltransferase involved in cell wall biosynthesis
LKILYVIPSLSVLTGGPAKVAYEYCRELVRKGCLATIYTTNHGQEIINNKNDNIVNRDGVNIYYFNLNHPKNYFFSFSLTKALYENIQNFDIVHIHSIWLYPTLITSLFCRKFGVPYLIKCAGALSSNTYKKRSLKKQIYLSILEKKSLKNAAAIHYVSSDEKTDSAISSINNNSLVIPNGIHFDDLLPTSNEDSFFKEYPATKNKKIILFLARIHPIKGLDRLIRAFSTVVRQYSNAHLLVVGPDDGYQKSIESNLDTLGIRNNVTFTGLITGRDKIKILYKSDIFCLPSYHEAQSISILEAMGCGLPVIISPECKFNEIQEAGAGIVFDNSDENLSKSLLLLLNDYDLRKKMGRNAKKLVEKKYTWDKVAEQMINEYQKIINKINLK